MRKVAAWSKLGLAPLSRGVVDRLFSPDLSTVFDTSETPLLVQIDRRCAAWPGFNYFPDLGALVEKLRDNNIRSVLSSFESHTLPCALTAFDDLLRSKRISPQFSASDKPQIAVTSVGHWSYISRPNRQTAFPALRQVPYEATLHNTHSRPEKTLPGHEEEEVSAQGEGFTATDLM
ncbi:hypothetical protein V494_03824 [Pseudogymnoascus sp. VKM F-4513 (FW-928)]|nr:hypothetical protein V494_03824 [Pseudogymnoascus sp. VKM F-4513 (FW-928)]